MASAIFGLVGVVIGGIIAVLGQMYSERRRAASELRRAKRLVDGELFTCQLSLMMVATGDGPIKYPDFDSIFPTDSWKNHKAHLAETVSDTSWKQLTGTYAIIERHKAIVALSVDEKQLISDDDWAEVKEEFAKTAKDIETLRESLA